MKGLLWHDLHHGFLRRWRTLLGLLLFVAIVFGFFAFRVHLENLNGTGLTPGAQDYLLELLAGTHRYEAPPEHEPDFPAVWLVFHLLVCAWSAFYLEGDLKGYGPAFLVGTGSRKKYWWSKVLWCAAAQILVYALVFLLALAFALPAGGGLGSDPRTAWAFFWISPGPLWPLFLRSVGISLLVTLAVTQCQMTLTLYFSAMAGYVVTAAQLLLVAVFQAGFIPFRYTLLDANRDLVPWGLVLPVIVALAALALGAHRMKTIDVC